MQSLHCVVKAVITLSRGNPSIVRAVEQVAIAHSLETMRMVGLARVSYLASLDQAEPSRLQ